MQKKKYLGSFLKAEFVQDEKDMLVSITSLKGAVITLSKAHIHIALGRGKQERRNGHRDESAVATAVSAVATAVSAVCV